MSRQRTGYDRDNRNSDSGRYGRTHRGENYGNYGGRSQEDDYDDNGHRYRQDDYDYEDDYDDNRGGRGRQGFASMDPGRQRAIAAKGGRHSHDNDDYNDNGRRYRNRQDDYDYEDDYDDNRGGHGRQGFASMDPGRQRAIAAKGGRHSHDNDDDRRYDDEDDYDYYDEYDDRDYDDDYEEDENEGEDNRRSGRGYRQSGGPRGHQSRNPDGTFASTSRSGRRRGSGGDTSKRGFASMNKSEVRRIAAMGGRASHGGHSGSRSSRRGR